VTTRYHCRYDPQYALEADSIIHRGSGLGSVSLLHAEPQGAEHLSRMREWLRSRRA
jgi:hypothetical protein